MTSWACKTRAVWRTLARRHAGSRPILINRPIVVTPATTRPCRSSEAVLELLPALPGPFAKEDGELVIDAKGPRVACG